MSTNKLISIYTEERKNLSVNLKQYSSESKQNLIVRLQAKYRNECIYYQKNISTINEDNHRYHYFSKTFKN